MSSTITIILFIKNNHATDHQQNLAIFHHFFTGLTRRSNFTANLLVSLADNFFSFSLSIRENAV